MSFNTYCALLEAKLCSVSMLHRKKTAPRVLVRRLDSYLGASWRRKSHPDAHATYSERFPRGLLIDVACSFCTQGRKRRHFTEIRDDGYYMTLIFHLDKEGPVVVQTCLTPTLQVLLGSML